LANRRFRFPGNGWRPEHWVRTWGDETETVNPMRAPARESDAAGDDGESTVQKRRAAAGGAGWMKSRRPRSELPAHRGHTSGQRDDRAPAREETSQRGQVRDRGRRCSDAGALPVNAGRFGTGQ
jgi:hypothetical protein